VIEISERGPWRVINQGTPSVAVMSDDFTHDVILKISGDFADQAQRDEYARRLAWRMTRMPDYFELPGATQ